MHKFYWNNTHRSSSGNGVSSSASASSCNASCSSSNMAGGPAGCSGVKIADNQVLQQQSCSDFPRVNTMQHHHPQVPMRANGGTATIRVEQTTVGHYFITLLCSSIFKLNYVISHCGLLISTSSSLKYIQQITEIRGQQPPQAATECYSSLRKCRLRAQLIGLKACTLMTAKTLKSRSLCRPQSPCMAFTIAPGTRGLWANISIITRTSTTITRITIVKVVSSISWLVRRNRREVTISRTEEDKLLSLPNVKVEVVNVTECSLSSFIDQRVAKGPKWEILSAWISSLPTSIVSLLISPIKCSRKKTSAKQRPQGKLPTIPSFNQWRYVPYLALTFR